ncbi:MAG: hypothetical protein KIT58_16990 [Planctomycetota bacterium]|nr:hypothetical protein [Planctomycetota bacterium]
MAHTVDPRLRRFLAQHSVSVEAEVEADVAEARGLGPGERWRQLERLSGVLAWVGAGGALDRARVLEHRDPPHPTYAAIIARLRAGRARS